MSRTAGWWLGLALLGATAAARADTGLELAHECMQAMRLHALGLEALEIDAVVEGVYCVGYVMGVMEGLVRAEEIGSRPARIGNRFCPPESGIEAEEAVLAFLRWAEQHTAELDEPARVAVQRALAEAYPCAAEKRRPKRAQ